MGVSGRRAGGKQKSRATTTTRGSCCRGGIEEEGDENYVGRSGWKADMRPSGSLAASMKCSDKTACTVTLGNAKEKRVTGKDPP